MPAVSRDALVNHSRILSPCSIPAHVHRTSVIAIKDLTMRFAPYAKGACTVLFFALSAFAQDEGEGEFIPHDKTSMHLAHQSSFLVCHTYRPFEWLRFCFVSLRMWYLDTLLFTSSTCSFTTSHHLDLMKYEFTTSAHSYMGSKWHPYI